MAQIDRTQDYSDSAEGQKYMIPYWSHYGQSQEYVTDKERQLAGADIIITSNANNIVIDEKISPTICNRIPATWALETCSWQGISGNKRLRLGWMFHKNSITDIYSMQCPIRYMGETRSRSNGKFQDVTPVNYKAEYTAAMWVMTEYKKDILNYLSSIGLSTEYIIKESIKMFTKNIYVPQYSSKIDYQLCDGIKLTQSFSFKNDERPINLVINMKHHIKMAKKIELVFPNGGNKIIPIDSYDVYFRALNKELKEYDTWLIQNPLPSLSQQTQQAL